jgi:S-adenosylmethionine decarboxylase
MDRLQTPLQFEHFGEHITIDGYFGDASLLNDRENVRASIDELPVELGMKKLSSPEVYFAKGNNIKDPGGWSGFVVIEESHISVHTFPAVGFVSIDVYTCRNGLDQNQIIKYFERRFDLKDVEVNFIKRGLKFPDAVRRLVESETGKCQ